MERKRSPRDVPDQGANTSGMHERAKRISGPVIGEGATDAMSAPPVAALTRREAITPADSPQAIRASRPSMVSVRSSSLWKPVRLWLERWRRSG